MKERPRGEKSEEQIVILCFLINKEVKLWQMANSIAMHRQFRQYSYNVQLILHDIMCKNPHVSNSNCDIKLLVYSEIANNLIVTLNQMY